MVKTLPRLAPAAVAALLALSLTGCQAYSRSAKAESAPPPPTEAQQNEALTFSQAACGGCHSVEYPDLSPNPNAPTFASIANREGLTQDTLASWLADAHNYPEVMDFDLNADQVEVIAQHMLTLRSEDYVPVE
ncbi:MAG: hypothetical protein AAGE86_06450 [Pseudomonadota bacterium]